MISIIPAEWEILQFVNNEKQHENPICPQCGQIGKHYGTVNGVGFYLCYESDRKSIGCVTWK